MKSYLSEDLSSSHENSEETAKKSQIMTLPVLMKHEIKYSDCVDVLNQLKQWMHEIYEASGLCETAQSSTPTETPVEVPTRRDQPRTHIPPV